MTTGLLIQVLADGGRTLDPRSILTPGDLSRLLKAMGVRAVIELTPGEVLGVEGDDE